MSACASSRSTATREVSSIKIQDSRARDSLQVTAFSQLDSLVEITTVTIDRNEAGDTLRQSVVTDRLRTRTRDFRAEAEVRIVEKTDTVYIERRDSVLIQDSEFKVQGAEKKSSFVSSLKWIFAILVALIVLLLAIRFGRGRS